MKQHHLSHNHSDLLLIPLVNIIGSCAILNTMCQILHSKPTTFLALSVDNHRVEVSLLRGLDIINKQSARVILCSVVDVRCAL